MARSGNSNLHDSSRNKQDEFYTNLQLIEDELKHYRAHFAGKRVLCNCDDPYESNFFKYFAMNFNALGLKSLTATCYAASPFAQLELDLFGEESSLTGLTRFTGCDVRGGCLSRPNDAERNNRSHPNPDNPVNPVRSKIPYKIVINEVTDVNGDGRIDLADVEWLIKNKKNVLTKLKGDGDFRSAECVALLDEADVVVTNPPFSLFREYMALLMEHQKQFLIVGNMNAVTYKEVFPLIKDNKVWLGNKSGHFWFKVPQHYEEKATDFKIDENGQKWRRMGNICWFTNLDFPKRHEKMLLWKKYTPEAYPKYDNYDAIEVSKTDDIPCDYYEAIGVPITFISKHNPSQFELLGIDKDFTIDGQRFKLAKDNGGGVFICSPRDKKEMLMRILRREYGYTEKEISYRSGYMGVPITFMSQYNPEQFEIIRFRKGDDDRDFTINGKPTYFRIVIRRKEGAKG